MKFTRKSFLQVMGASLIGAFPGASQARSVPPPKADLKLGLASYSLRNYSLDEVLEMCNRLGLKYLALKSMHLPLDTPDQEIAAIAKKVRDAGIQLYGASVVYMKSAAAVENAFRYAVAAGLEMIIGVPNHDLLPLVEKQVKATNIKLAIHNHGPGDKLYPSPESVYEKVKNLDSRMGLCVDIGHTIRIGLDPVKNLRKYADRLYDIHLTDVNKAAPEGHSIEVGRGVIDIPAVLKVLQKIKYQGVMSLEFEKDANDTLPGLAECVGYVRGVLDA
ncbi:MAG: sugar phosphate isomerase/epimerase [Saprospiraceae bacterium]|nr:sugar phosphate isomerase/epimerase [Saprospiraceae bacterium]